MSDRFVIVLAAGKGTRMKSKLYKVLHKVCGKAMVDHVVTQAEALNPKEIITIVGFGAEEVKHVLNTRTSYVLQKEQLGTGHAVLQVKEQLEGKKGTTLVLSGDTPLFTSETLEKLFVDHQKHHRSATVLSAIAQDPTGYGRIVRNQTGELEKIVEQKDATKHEQEIKEINTGTYCFDNELLFKALESITTNNAQGEYYLTDIIEILKEQHYPVGSFVMDDFSESMGVNDRLALARAQKVMQRRINRKHMKNGVTFLDPTTTYIETDVVIGQDTIIEGNVTLKGKTTIGNECYITSGSRLENTVLEQNVTIKHSQLEDSTVKSGTDIGPYAHLRPQSEIGKNVHIGNFVEVKKATIGDHTKVGHLTYVGDATLGKEINVSCGVIFANYDGKNKYHTTVGNHAFIGSNVNLVAPLTIEDGAFLAAGSTIYQDVPKDAMAIARSKQAIKEEYAKKLPYHE